MFRAVGRYMRALGYLMVGKVDRARQSLSQHPDVVRATFDRVIQDKKARIQEYKEAVGAMIAQEEKKKGALKRISDEVEKLQKLRDGAAAAARKIVDRHNGNADEVKRDPEYIRCQAAFKDFSSTLAEKEERCKGLEDDIKALAQGVSGHKIQLEGLLRELDQIKQEKHATVADLMTAREEQEIADMISGISNDKTNEELQELREVRDRAKATARVSREVAGLDAKQSEAEFLEYASETASNDEFDALIGLSKETDASNSDTPERTRLPES